MKLYLSGPISGHDRSIVEETFSDAAKRLEAIGHQVVNPFVVCMPLERFWIPETEWGQEKHRPKYLKYNLEAMIHCEGIVQLGGWRTSRGATLEAVGAVQTGMKTFTYTEEDGLEEYTLTVAEAVRIHAKVEAAWEELRLLMAPEFKVPNPKISIMPKAYDPKAYETTMAELEAAIGPVMTVYEGRTPESVLAEADRIVNGDRRKDYGHPLDNFTFIAEFWDTYLQNKSRLTGLPISIQAEDVALMMDLTKVAREANNPKRDNRVDGPGYWKCLDLVHEERKRRAAE